MSGLFSRIDVWARFGRFTNSRFGLAFQERFRKTVERLMLPLSESSECDVSLVRLDKPLEKARVTLVTTTGIYLEGQRPFDTAAAKGDPTYRIIPSSSDTSQLRIAHTHYAHERAEKGVNVIFPIERLRELAEEGAIGSVAPSLFSYGFDLHVDELIGPGGSARRMARIMKQENVDVALLTPG